MEIHNNKSKPNILYTVRNKLRRRRIIAILFAFLVLAGFGIGCIVFGAYLNKTGQTWPLKALFVRTTELDFSFIPKKVKSETIKIENFSIDIKFKHWEKIRYHREQALLNELITPETEEEFPATITYNGNTYPVDLSLTGWTIAHIMHPYKWSLSVKVKDEGTIMGMRRFALLVPETRGYLTDWIATEMLKSQDVIGIRGDFVEVSVNGKAHGLFYVEERFDKRLIENNHFREGIIFRFYDDGIQAYGLSRIISNEGLNSQLISLERLIQSYLSGNITAERVFDLEKFASLAVISDILGTKHPLMPSNLRMYYNPITGLIEPIGREWGYFRKETKIKTSLSIGRPDPEADYDRHVDLYRDPIMGKFINSFAFQEQYIKQAVKLTNPSFLDSLIKENEAEIERLLNKVYVYNPFYIFPKDIMRENQRYLRDKIRKKDLDINVYFDFIKEDTVFLSVENQIDLPIEIYYFEYNKKHIFFPPGRILLESNYNSDKSRHAIAFCLNDSINSSAFSPDSLMVYYSVLGLGNKRKTIVFPQEMIESHYLDLIPTTQPDNIHDFSFLNINDKDSTIEFAAGKCNIQKNLIIPEGYVVSAKPGCQIDLTNSAKIISHSPILFFGRSDSLISITSSDSTGQGMVIMNCDLLSELSYVSFNGLSNISEGSWELTGAITFYNAPVNITNCTFYNNLRGDDYLNIIRSDFNIHNTSFTNINADAFDADFCTGTIEASGFYQVGNDAIDVSGTRLFIKDVEIVGHGDKGISGGEESHLICKNIDIRDSEIAVASKDNSTIEIKGIQINTGKLAYCAYQKKSEFGPGVIEVYDAVLINVDKEHLIENGSSLIIEGKQVVDKSNNVQDKLYGVEYGKPSE